MRVFLEATHERILERYAEYINNWKEYVNSAPVAQNLNEGTHWLRRLGLKKEEVVNIRSQIKFVNQWFFIELTKRIVTSGLQHAILYIFFI